MGEEVSQELEKSVAGMGNNKCNSLEVGTYLTCMDGVVGVVRAGEKS